MIYEYPQKKSFDLYFIVLFQYLTKQENDYLLEI